ncbi:MAG: endonuclease MutS2 [Candidatus Latescibacteria bacterium]|nr:endonuclease MutS2 [Candidatus Latescibacterota bacterium]
MEQFPGTSYNIHALRVLEFDRVLDIAASLAESGEGRAAILDTRPSPSAPEIREMLQEVGELMDAIRFDDPVPGTGVLDIREIFPLLDVQGYILEIEHIAAVADNLETARNMRDYFEERREKYPLIRRASGLLIIDEELERRIRRVVTPELAIADDASKELQSIRRRLVRARSSLRDLVEKTLSGLPDDIVADRIVTIRNNRFVIPVRDSMKKRVQGAVHDRSQTGRTLFIEPLASIEGNNLVNELEMAEQAEIKRILADLSERIARISHTLVRNQDILVGLDVTKAKAKYGVRSEGVIPKIGGGHEIFIKKGRHPVLDWKHRKQKGDTAVVPLDLDIGGDYETIVVTGPNAGGKTVALKTVGLLTVMATAGFPIPAAEDTVVCVPEGVFADIGDEQSIDDDLSTFSSHMQQIVTVLDKAEEGSLVLLDELGGGTNPADGEAIALAVLKELTLRRALTVATTHHGGLKVFAHETPGAANASLEFDRERLMPTFLFRTGIPGSSYAFEIAGRMGLPTSVLREAELLAGSERKSLERLIAELEEQVRLAREEHDAAARALKRSESARIEHERKREELSRRRSDLLEEALEESKRIVDDAGKRIESSIREIREKEASREAILAAKKSIASLKKEIETKLTRISKKRLEKDSRPLVRELRQGMTVFVKSLGSEAAVEEVLDAGGKARVRVGKGKASFVVNRGDCFESDSKPEKAAQVVRVNVHSSGVDSTEIDLRGMTFDEALTPLGRFLDGLHLAGYETGSIIHGKGTGALRKKITAYLDDHEYVASHRLGSWNEGGAGVTIVTLWK